MNTETIKKEITIKCERCWHDEFERLEKTNHKWFCSSCKKITKYQQQLNHKRTKTVERIREMIKEYWDSIRTQWFEPQKPASPYWESLLNDFILKENRIIYENIIREIALKNN